MVVEGEQILWQVTKSRERMAEICFQNSESVAYGSYIHYKPPSIFHLPHLSSLWGRTSLFGAYTLRDMVHCDGKAQWQGASEAGL